MRGRGRSYSRPVLFVNRIMAALMIIDKPRSHRDLLLPASKQGLHHHGNRDEAQDLRLTVARHNDGIAKR